MKGEDIRDNLLGWSPHEAANRAVQALYGFASLALPSNGNERLLSSFARDALESARILERKTPAECVELVDALRLDFIQMASKSRFVPLVAEPARIWQLFMERFDFPSCQLRSTVIDILECFDLSELGRVYGEDAKYFRRLPLSSELVLSPAGTGLHADLVIPPRLLLLDTILMLRHAEMEHIALAEEAAAQRDAAFISVRPSGRLDSYVRQAIMLATSVCDNILNEYGYAVAALIKKQPHSGEILEEVNRLAGRGVTARLREAPTLWARALKRPNPGPPPEILDMLTLVEIRNRLIHPDGRINCWYAFNLAPSLSSSWQWSPRFDRYAEACCYGVSGSHLGGEWVLARFCVDTVLLVVDFLHRVVYAEDQEAPWLKLPRDEDTGLDLAAAIKSERLLRGTMHIG